MQTTIAQKVIGLMKEIGAIPKNSVNKFHNYKYRSHEDVMNALQPALVKAGLLLVPIEKTVTLIGPGHVIIEVRYRLTDGAEHVEFVGIGEGQDISREGKPGDKAAYKAQTGALKYALNDVLALGTQDDPEADINTHADKPPKREEPAKVADVEAASQQANDYAAMLDEAKDSADLELLWSKVPPAYRSALFNHKKAVKAKLGGK